MEALLIPLVVLALVGSFAIGSLRSDVKRLLQLAERREKPDETQPPDKNA
jgi:hypothetical protein